jgi:pimeloyl-ACP methyl ester carboxylesterase
LPFAEHVLCPDPRKHPIDYPDPGRACGHKTAELGKNYDEGDLPHVCRFPSHIRPSQQQNLAPLTIQERVIGHKSFFLVGHDWGGPTAYALAAAHPEAVRRLVILDVVIPGSGGDFSEGGRRWHHQFHMTPDLPEVLTQGREDAYLAWFYRTFAYRPDAIGPDDLQEYLRTYRQPGAMRAGFALYRAIPQDAADNQATIARFKLPMPVLAMGGAVSYPHGRGRGSEPEQSLRRVAVDVRGEVVPDCGHFIPEEAPDVLNARLLAFFDQQ